MDTPTIGHTVHVVLEKPLGDWEGADVAPGVVTRVVDDEHVNVTALPDGQPARAIHNVPLYADEDTARDERGEQLNVAFWPPRAGGHKPAQDHDQADAADATPAAKKAPAKKAPVRK